MILALNFSENTTVTLHKVL